MPRYHNTSIRNLLYRLRKFEPILETELKKEIENREDILTDIIRTQLDLGVDGYYDDIKPPYAPSTIKKKIRKGQPTDRVTLRDTGQFYDSFKIEFDEDGFRVVSKDDKAKYLIARYGEAILRISDEDLTRFIRLHIRPALEEKMKEYLRNG